MIGAIRNRIDKALGRGRHSIAVPVMDGPLHPNNRLEAGSTLFEAPELDNLVTAGDAIWFSSGSDLMRYTDGAVETVATLDAPITCLAADTDGTLAIGLDGIGMVLRGGPHDGERIERLGDTPLTCPTATAFVGEELVICMGARDRLHADWKRDLMAHGRTGEVWEVNLRSGDSARLAGGLAWPYGVAETAEGIAVSEAWAHRIVQVAANHAPKVLIDALPGYPARLVKRARGGYLLAVFAARNQLIEFVLREPEFLSVMTQQVHPDNWIAPKLMWGQGFKEPMQGAALKTMGIIKPWAPTWSYGLVVALDDAFHPLESYHSRADGKRHGVTSVCEVGGTVIAGARGAHQAVALDTPERAQ